MNWKDVRNGRIGIHKKSTISHSPSLDLAKKNKIDELKFLGKYSENGF
jgi:hypothetical protein